MQAGDGFDVHIVEIGGTVGDYESLSFVEAIRELGIRVGLENCAYVHVVYMPFLNASNETKTKPAQNSVRELRGLGISPDVLVARSEQPAREAARQKLSLFSGVAVDSIALLPNAPFRPFPAGFDARPTPFGVSFTGMACSEPRLIELAYAFEQATMKRVPPASAP